MVETGRKGQAALVARLAAEAGIDLDALDPEDRAVRARAILRAHMVRLNEARWGREATG